MKILLASNNAHKVKELKDLLCDVEIITPKDLNDNFEVIEDGKTLEENSFKKASYYHDHYDYDVVSDDTGLFCNGLDGMPGIYSARYASLGCDHEFSCDTLNREKLLRELQGKDRNAYFKTVICFYEKSGKVNYFEGKCEGRILEKEEGENGFGYDVLFYSYDLNKTFGTATEEEKNMVSHRFKASNKLKEYINLLNNNK